MNRWRVPERLVRAYKSQPAAIVADSKEEKRRKRKMQKETVNAEGRERQKREREEREASLTKRFTRLFAATNNLFMESDLKPLRER